MKEFWQVLVKYVKPYKGYLGGSIVLNILSAILNIFSFSLIIPILQILFKMNDTVYSFIPWDTAGMGLKDIVINNAYYGITLLIQTKGAAITLFLLCLWLSIMTLLKTACYFGSSAIMIPIRTSVVRDMRRELYNKILSLPLGFFSEERKGDIIARMSGDINEVENSIMSTLDMLLKNPILIIFYIGTLIVTSWQLTVFTIVVAPVLIWLMSALGRTLKRDRSRLRLSGATPCPSSKRPSAASASSRPSLPKTRCRPDLTMLLKPSRRKPDAWPPDRHWHTL